jgi:hypothetical protein
MEARDLFEDEKRPTIEAKETRTLLGEDQTQFVVGL